MYHEQYQIERIYKPDSNKVWAEITIGFDTVPFRDPLMALPTDEQLAEIQQWCVEHKCGVRMSYQQFVFNNEKELNMFMLKWA